MKKLLLYVVLLMTVSCAMLGCNGKDYFYDGDYVYWIDYNSKYATLLDVKNTDNKEVLEIPLKANGFDVTMIGGNVNMYEYRIKCDNVLDIHIPHSVHRVTKFAFSSTSVERIFLENCEEIVLGISAKYMESSPYFYVATELMPQYISHYKEYPKIVNNLQAANLTFRYNYDDSPNLGIYSLGHIDNENPIIFPQIDPKRNGFKFSGWYLDKECTQSYNIEKFSEQGEYNFYAKWEE